jgi:carboxyl-terminal processing protease
MLDENIGYIKLTGFTENAGNEVREALTNLKTQHNIKALVFDLRGNPGGLLNEAVNISNVFIEKGLEVVSTKGKVKEWDKVYKAINTPVDVTIPVAVLVNSGSASASEIVSGSLQDLDRGIVIGQRTFGKGLVQTTRPLSYNTQLKVTTAKYYIPSGRCIQAIDYSHRNEDGSVGKVPDSLISVFKTKNGRAVYDGGGIIPDITTEPYKPSNIAISLYTKLLIFDFVTLYKLKHPSIPKAKEFKVTEEDFNEFVNYISDKDYDYTTKSEKTLEDLKDNAQKEKYYEDIKAEFEALRSKMIHNKKEDLVKNKQEIMQMLKDEIVARYYYQSGRIEASFDYDVEIAKAIELLNNKNQYTSVLAGTYKKTEDK